MTPPGSRWRLHPKRMERSSRKSILPSWIRPIFRRSSRSSLHRDDGRELLRAALEGLHFHSAADHERRALMNRLGKNFQNPSLSVRSHASGLFRDERERIRLIHQTQLPVGMALRRRIEKDAALQ